MNDAWKLPKPDKEFELIEALSNRKLRIQVFGDNVIVGIEGRGISLTKEQFEELKLWMVLG